MLRGVDEGNSGQVKRSPLIFFPDSSNFPDGMKNFLVPLGTKRESEDLEDFAKATGNKVSGFDL